MKVIQANNKKIIVYERTIKNNEEWSYSDKEWNEVLKDHKSDIDVELSGNDILYPLIRVRVYGYELPSKRDKQGNVIMQGGIIDQFFRDVTPETWKADTTIDINGVKCNHVVEEALAMVFE